MMSIITSEKLRSTLLAAVSAALLLAASVPAAAQGGKLPERYQKWLDEEAVYIIKPLERDVFLKLVSDRERDGFIEAFWRVRDPAPSTPENEFRTEHYRRIAHVNRYYGRTSPLPGWRSDRGRIYIILGEPNDIQRFDGKAGAYNAEVWFFQDKGEGTARGLPAGFNLVFFQKNNIGDYQLYSPSKDGPQALLVDFYGDPADYQRAYEALREIDATLASVSLSLIPGETSGMIGRPSLASDMLIQRIENASRALVEEKYAAKFLEYKDIVEVEYSTNFLDSDGLIKVARPAGGPFFVHYAVEPKRLSLGEYGGSYSTTLRINGSVAGADGRLVHQFEKTAAVKLDAAQLRERSGLPFVFHDLFPLVGGTYRITILVKNEASKEFSTLEETVVVPGDGAGVQMTAPLLGYRTQPAETGRNLLKPFQFGPTQVYFQPNRVFTRGDSLALAFQVLGLTANQASGARIRYTATRDGQPFKEWERAYRDYPAAPDIVESVPVAEFPPAHYAIRAALLVDGREVVAAADEFDVSHQETIPRPWIHSKLMPEPGDPAYDAVLGSQLLAIGRISDARTLLERARVRMPGSSEAALSLARLYAETGEWAGIAPLLEPFLVLVPPPAYEIWILAAEAGLKTGLFDRAVSILDQAVTHYGVNTSLLNLLGDGYLGMKRTKDALAVWNKSLEMNPDQTEVRRKIESLKDER